MIAARAIGQNAIITPSPTQTAAPPKCRSNWTAHIAAIKLTVAATPCRNKIEIAITPSPTAAKGPNEAREHKDDGDNTCQLEEDAQREPVMI